MNSNNKIPSIILNGFLGSGKTTLFRSLLSQSKKKNITTCAIVNDMSELDVDGELLGNTDVIEENNNLLESIHSCVLSSKKGIKKLDKAIQKLISKQNPELIIIETSGSCHPMPLIEYFKNHPKAKLNGVFTLVDCLMLAHDFDYGQRIIPLIQNNIKRNKRNTVNLLVEQIMFCSHLFLTKADRIKEEENISQIASHIQNINPHISIQSIFFGNLGIESLFKLKEYNYFKVAKLITELKPILESEERNKPYNIATRVIKDDRPFHPQRLWNICHKYLDKRIYRSKGFFWLASRNKHSLLWNQVAGGISLELIGAWRSGIIEDENNGLLEVEIKHLKELIAKESGRFGDRHCNLTIIGDETQVDRFTDALRLCFLNDEEIALWANGYNFDDPWPKKLAKLI